MVDENAASANTGAQGTHESGASRWPWPGRHVQMDAVRQMLTAKELAVHAYLEALLERSIEPQVLH